ncbi:hypothetical protein [Kribbella sp. HUAS MG21]|uniref:Uncharacterized protein n=1 Tax=Kribbella sp. HUAS MG21 TaxID=3160966 RepID=A0AAU7T4Y4_9ACTN
MPDDANLDGNCLASEPKRRRISRRGAGTAGSRVRHAVDGRQKDVL